MNKRDKIIQAALNIEGSEVMLSEKWDCYLIGYTIQEGSKTVLGVYDMTVLVSGNIDREDAVIEELKAINGCLKPVLVHSLENLGFPFNIPSRCAVGSCMPHKRMVKLSTAVDE